MDRQVKTPLEVFRAKEDRTGVCITDQLSLPLLSYGIGTGLVATAAGALIAAGLTGRGQIITWIMVTSGLGAAAIWLSEPTLALVSRVFRLGPSDRARG